MNNHEEVIHALKTWRKEYAEEFGDTGTANQSYIQGLSAAIRVVKSMAAPEEEGGVLVKNYEAMYKRLKAEIESSLAVAEENLVTQNTYDAGYHGAWADAAAFMYQIEEDCPAVSAQFGPGDVHCSLVNYHLGNHDDGKGHSWFNLSEVIREEYDD